MTPVSYKQESGTMERLPCPGAPQHPAHFHHHLRPHGHSSPSPRMPRTPTAIHHGGSASEPCTPSLSAQVCSEGRDPRAGLTFPCCLRPRVRGGTGGHAQSAQSWRKGRVGRLRASSGDGSRGSAVALSVTAQLQSEHTARLPRHLATSWRGGARG